MFESVPASTMPSGAAPMSGSSRMHYDGPSMFPDPESPRIDATFSTSLPQSRTRAELNEEVMSPDDLIIGVMGMTGAGKTTFVSRCLGEDVGIGHGLRSYTQDVAIHSFMYRGRTVRLIDTPGFDDTSKSDVNILKNIAFWLSHAYRSQPRLLLSGIIYLHPISETRMSGTAIKNIEMMKRLCGDAGLPVIWLATTMWDRVDPKIGAQRERELISDDAFWGSLLRHGASVLRHQNTEASALGIIDDIASRDQRVILAVQRQMVDERLDVDQTDAGRHLCRVVQQEQRKVQLRLQSSAHELEEKLEARQTAEADEVRERQANYKQQLADKDRSLEALRRDMAQLRKDKAIEFQQREETFERQKREQDAKLADVTRQLKDLRVQRHDAVVDSEEAGNNSDDDFALMMKHNQEVIAGIDAEIERRREEARAVQLRQEAIAKQEAIFKQTLKVSAVNLLIRGAVQIASQIVVQACSVM